MEDSPIVSPPITSPIAPIQNPSFFNRFSPRKGKSFLLLFVMIGILALGGGMFAYNNSRNSDQGAGNENGKQEAPQFIANNVIVYGYWVAENAVIAMHDLVTNNSEVVAVLPTNIKHVKIASPTELFFIADTNELDHGENISVRALGSDVSSPIFMADDGYGIDDYVVSPNGTFIAVWEVKLAEDAGDLMGGSSRVYVFNRATNAKHLIYDEVFSPSIPVHYPVGITDIGELFADRFLANSGAGWAYGMSRSNFDGTQKSDIAALQNGAYGTQPVMSSDGKYIAFAGYSGTDGATEVNGYRRAVVAPNTVKLLNTATGAIATVKEQSSNTTYTSVYWDKVSGALFFLEGIFSDGDFSLSQYSYSPEISSEIKIAGADTFAEKSVVIASLTNSQYLFGNRESSDAFLGNLSGKYEQSMQSIFAFKTNGESNTPIDVEISPLQIIGVKSSSYFTAATIQQIAEEGQQNQLQLQTFVIKPALAPKREKLQSELPDLPSTQPGCAGYASQMCGGYQMYDPNFIPSSECIEWMNTPGVCADSPLYLYGEEGQKVSVQIGVPLYSPNIPYSPEKGVEAEISSNGSFYANGKLIEGFSFDYAPAVKKINRPEYGKIVARNSLEKTLKSFATSLGLNQKETADLLSEAASIQSSYQYVSFFNHEMSHKILPLYFTPTPDNYRNIVFYIEEFNTKPNLKPKVPSFDPIVRIGLTAIETSLFVR